MPEIRQFLIPLARPIDRPRQPECPQCKVPLQPLPDEAQFERDRQIWECKHADIKSICLKSRKYPPGLSHVQSYFGVVA